MSFTISWPSNACVNNKPLRLRLYVSTISRVFASVNFMTSVKRDLPHEKRDLLCCRKRPTTKARAFPASPLSRASA